MLKWQRRIFARSLILYRHHQRHQKDQQIVYSSKIPRDLHSGCELSAMDQKLSVPVVGILWAAIIWLKLQDWLGNLLIPLCGHSSAVKRWLFLNARIETTEWIEGLWSFPLFRFIARRRSLQWGLRIALTRVWHLTGRLGKPYLSQFVSARIGILSSKSDSDRGLVSVKVPILCPRLDSGLIVIGRPSLKLFHVRWELSGDSTDDKAVFGLFSCDGSEGQLESLRIGSDKPDSRYGISL